MLNDRQRSRRQNLRQKKQAGNLGQRGQNRLNRLNSLRGNVDRQEPMSAMQQARPKTVESDFTQGLRQQAQEMPVGADYRSSPTQQNLMGDATAASQAMQSLDMPAPGLAATQAPMQNMAQGPQQSQYARLTGLRDRLGGSPGQSRTGPAPSPAQANSIYQRKY